MILHEHTPVVCDFQGENLNSGATKADYTILLETASCPVQQLSADRVTCTPPTEAPRPEETGVYEDGYARVKVGAGVLLQTVSSCIITHPSVGGSRMCVYDYV